MADQFFSGQKLRASALNGSVQYVSSPSASANIATSATAILTLTNCLFKAGRAYRIENIGGMLSDAAGRYGDFSLFKTSTAGTQYGAFYRTRGEGASQMNAYGSFVLRRSATTDLTVDLVLAVTASAGTVAQDAAANRPRTLLVTEIGPASLYAFAVDVT